MMGTIKSYQGTTEIDGKSVGISAMFQGLRDNGSFGPISLEPNATEQEEQLTAFLAEHPEGRTKEELIKILGLDMNRIVFTFLLSKLVDQGRLIIAKEKRKQTVQWVVTTDYGVGCYKPSGRETLTREELIDVYRLSPEAWIEAVS